MRGQGLSLFLVLLPSFIVTLTGLNQSSSTLRHYENYF